MKKVILFFVFQLFFSQFVFSGSYSARGQWKCIRSLGVKASPLLSLDEEEVLGSGLFIPPEFEILRFLSEKNSLSFEEGIEAMARLPHTIPMRDIYSPDDFVEKWQFLYNKVHNRFYIHSQAARLRQEISRLQFSPAGFFSRKIENEEEQRMVLTLKQEQLQDYEQLLSEEMPGARLLDYKPPSCSSDNGFCSEKNIEDWLRYELWDRYAWRNDTPLSEEDEMQFVEEIYQDRMATSQNPQEDMILMAIERYKDEINMYKGAPIKISERSESHNLTLSQIVSKMKDIHKELYKAHRKNTERVKDLQLVVSYIESLPEDVRTPEQRLELEWALDGLWANNLSLEGDSVWDWMDSLDESYTSPFSPSILRADLSPLTSKIRDFGVLYHAQRVFRIREPEENDFNAQRLIRFLGLSQGVFFNSDRLFGSLIQTSSLAAGLVLEEQKTPTLSTPKPNLLFGSMMQISSLAAGLVLEDQETPVLSAPEQQFLSKLGIQEMNPQGEFADLSHLYGAVEDQGWTSACVGFSVAHDIQFELNQKGEMRRDEFISPFAVYGALHAYSKGDQPDHCLTYYSQRHMMYAGPSPKNPNYDGKASEGIDSHVIDQALDGLSSESVCVMSDTHPRSQAERSTYVSSRVRVKDYQIYGQRISFELLRVLIENNKPPILLLSTDKKTVREDWEEMEPACGSMGHSVIVVGYGMDEINPFTLKREPYLIVRDSLNLYHNRIHYKVRAENLLEFTMGLVKVTEVERV